VILFTIKPLTHDHSQRRMKEECRCVQVPDGRWVSLEPVGLFILDKEKDKTIINDHRYR